MTTITIQNERKIRHGRGFANLLRKELGGWWRTGAWIIHLLAYLLLVNGLTAFDAWDTRQAGGEAAEVFVGFFVFHALFVMAGVVISAQGSIVGERQDGTAAWILSKPVSRQAFLLSKLAALGGSFIAVGVLAPVVITFFTWSWLGFPPVWAALPLVLLGLGLSVLFYVSFSLWMGTLFASRKAVAALGFLMLFAQLQLGDRAIGAYLPGGLVFQLSAAVAGFPTTTLWLALGTTAVFTALFTILALRRLTHVEF